MKPISSSLLFYSSLAAVSILFTSCVAVTPPVPKAAERIMYQWYDTGGPGKVSVSIDLGEQIATVKRGDREIGWAFVATGVEGRGTPAGNYSITEKIVDKYSNRYGWIENEFGEVIDNDASPGDYVPPGAVYNPAPMPYWMRLTDYGIGMHVGKIPQPGEPASHGCIRMPEKFVPSLYDRVEIGTRVKITY
ncbi:MAG: L,D-transpeptidase family protein [Luteolibacter sp.]